MFKPLEQLASSAHIPVSLRTPIQGLSSHLPLTQSWLPGIVLPLSISGVILGHPDFPASPAPGGTLWAQSEW